MLILSDAIIRVDRKGRVRMEGVKRLYQRDIADLLRDLGVRGITIRLRSGRILFSGRADPSTQQRIRNFLVNIRELVER